MLRPNSSEVISAIRAFRAVVEQGSHEDYGTLIAATTKLLETASRMKGEAVDGDVVERPDRSASEDHRIVQAKFAHLHTNHADDITAEEWTIMPLNDLGDLYHDICVVDDLFLDGFEADARWQFRFGFENHWGEHALSLIGYLLRSYRF